MKKWLIICLLGGFVFLNSSFTKKSNPAELPVLPATYELGNGKMNVITDLSF